MLFLLATLTVLLSSVAQAGLLAESGVEAGSVERIERKEFAQVVEYKMVMNRNDKLCTHMLDMFNRDLQEHGYLKYETHAEFQAVRWQKAKTYWEDRGEKHYREEPATKFDINNDGKDEFVIKRKTTVRGAEVDVINIFYGPDIDYSTVFSADDIRNSPGKISLSGGTYQLQPEGISQLKKSRELREIPSVVAGLSIFQPFMFEGVVYISMASFYEFLPAGLAKLHLIIKYRKGRLTGLEDHRGLAEDICYFEVITK